MKQFFTYWINVIHIFSFIQYVWWYFPFTRSLGTFFDLLRLSMSLVSYFFHFSLLQIGIFRSVLMGFLGYSPGLIIQVFLITKAQPLCIIFHHDIFSSTRLGEMNPFIIGYFFIYNKPEAFLVCLTIIYCFFSRLTLTVPTFSTDYPCHVVHSHTNNMEFGHLCHIQVMWSFNFFFNSVLLASPYIIIYVDYIVIIYLLPSSIRMSSNQKTHSC